MESANSDGYRRFRQAMEDGRLEAGKIVTQNELCDLLGLSMSPLRETLVLLEEFGLVEIKPRMGIRIVYPEIAFIRENQQFRSLIEVAALRVFADSVTGDWLEGMRARHEQQRRILKDSALTDDIRLSIEALDGQIHHDFVQSLGNRTILATHTRLQENLRMAKRVHRGTVYRTQLLDTIDEHMAVIDSLRARDTDGAIAHLEAHFRGASHRTLAV